MILTGLIKRLIKRAVRKQGSKYVPHQSRRERARRLRQVDRWQLRMAGSEDVLRRKREAA